VCKFGGSSLADSARLKEVTKLIELQASRCEHLPVVVLSAMGPSTNELLSAGDRALFEGIVDISSVRKRAYEACESLGLSTAELVDPLLSTLDQLLLGIKFIRELSPRTKDQLVSFGERMSVRIMAAHLRQNHGLPAQHFDAYDLGFITDSNFGNAEVLEETYENVRRALGEGSGRERLLPVVTGFIAKTRDSGCITTLGRGGSDLTASVLGAALGVDEVQVWKDVDGILSTDPRVVKHAVHVPLVTFEEASEMAYFGAKVLHPIAMQPAMRMNIPVRVKNSYNPTHPGTAITSSREVNSEKPVTALSIKRGVTVVDIVSTRMLGAYGFLAEVFKVFAQEKISVDMIASSEVSVSLTLDSARLANKDMSSSTATRESRYEQLEAALSEVANVSFTSQKAIISIVTALPRSSWVLANAMASMVDAGIDVEMISQGASKYNISFIVPESLAEKAIQRLHAAFFEDAACV